MQPLAPTAEPLVTPEPPSDITAIEQALPAATAAVKRLAQAQESDALGNAVRIPLELIKPSPLNPRRRVNAERLASLANSIANSGVIQPILVRPCPQARRGEPLYEIICGERRWRASRIAVDQHGAEHARKIPALFSPVDFSDEQLLELAIRENFDREDIHPMEQAEAFDALLHRPDGSAYMSPDELCARFAISRTLLFNRLKLLELCEAGRSAYFADKLSTAVAQRVARLPKPQQAEAVTHLVNEWRFNNQPVADRAAAEYIERHFHLALDAAPFKITDATLVHAAGSCRECPKRTGANPDLFADIKKGDTCIDRTCYQAKLAAHSAQLQARAKEAGHKVLTGRDAKKVLPYGASSRAEAGYLRLDEPEYSISDKPIAKLLRGVELDAADIVLVEDERSHELVRVVKESAVVPLLKQKGVIKGNRTPTTSAGEREREAKAKAETAWRHEVARECVSAIASNSTLAADGPLRDDLGIINAAAALLLHRLDHDATKRAVKLLGVGELPGSYAEAVPHLAALDDTHLLQHLLAFVLAGDVHVGAYSTIDKPARITAFAEALGIDHAAIKAGLKAEAKAKAAPKKAAKAAKAAADKPAVQPAAPKAAAVKYRDSVTGATWAGRGLQPAWVKAALAAGRTLAELAAHADATPPKAKRAKASDRANADTTAKLEAMLPVPTVHLSAEAINPLRDLAA